MKVIRWQIYSTATQTYRSTPHDNRQVVEDTAKMLNQQCRTTEFEAREVEVELDY